ncbi:maternal protein exuperantia [Diachasma alloeum]|uniref:maternal protein exuperantia n=1 Tax=Diachasma alloeum TaxID=454923 RepID=UPI0007381C8C|nr:maternal protein exuperantia [Diachasma alloeum]
MVSSMVGENGDAISHIRASPAEGIPHGDYRLVGWDMDTTGKMLVDEICQIAGYTPSSSFAQYVMPFKNLTPAAKKRHNLKVVTVGKYRLLKNSKTNKVLKTKSEISAITDFLDWLEEVKGDAADGVILIHHESRKVIPAMLLASLIKFNLLERFKKTVKGFANGFNIANVKCANTIRAFSLRTLSRVLLDQEVELEDASERARLALQIVQHLSIGEAKATEGSGDNNTTSKATIEFTREFVQPVEAEETESEELKLVLDRQHSLLPVFGHLLAMNRKERQHASPLRRLLAESNIDYAQLKETWSKEEKYGLEKLIKDRASSATNTEIEDLLEILECHFDPEKTPKVKVETKQRKRSKKNKENRKDASGIESPDTTTLHSPIKVTNESLDNAEVSPTTA